MAQERKLQIDGVEVSIKSGKTVAEDQSFSEVKNTVDTWLETRLCRGKTNDMDHITFREDRVEIAVDARGYKPQDLRCVVNATAIEVFAEIREKVCGGSSRDATMSRQYQLQRQVVPEQAVCILSQEGILLVSVPFSSA